MSHADGDAADGRLERFVKEEGLGAVLSAVGSISAVQGAVVSTELGGVVSEVGFQNGGEAKKGDVLIETRLLLSEDSTIAHGRSRPGTCAREFATRPAISRRAK